VSAHQGDLWGPALAEIDEGDTSTDSYCTPGEVLAPVHKVAKRVALDPWTNRYAISLGFVRAEVAWTLGSGRCPDPDVDPRPWPLAPGDFAWGNPKYSDPSMMLRRFVAEIERARAWGMLLVKTDNRTRWWAEMIGAHPWLVMWNGPVNFLLEGQRVKGNNFASTIMVVDATDVPRHERHAALVEAFEAPGLAWVYR
jgi:hypothetical protein